MTLGGLLKHMAWVEDYWFSSRLHGNDPEPAWAGVDWDVDPDWEWHSAADDEPGALRALWEDGGRTIAFVSPQLRSTTAVSTGWRRHRGRTMRRHRCVGSSYT